MFEFNDRNSVKKFELQNAAGLKFTFLENGAAYSLMHGDTLINQLLSNPVEGGVNNIYIRLLQGEKIKSFPILGPESDSEFLPCQNSMAWKGKALGMDYSCRLQLDPAAALWFWTVTVKNRSRQKIKTDIIFTQDVAIAARSAVLLNEAYISQYLDHTVLKDEKHGYVICSRQNQAQGRVFPWILHGCLGKAVGYLTDGFQFFGLRYKDSNQPEALKAPMLPNCNYQYEFAFPALQSQSAAMAPGQKTEVVFFTLFEPDHPQASQARDIRKLAKVAAAYKKLPASSEASACRAAPKLQSLFDCAPLFQSRELAPAELDRYFSPERRHAEKKSLSFFYGRNYYVALKAKEQMVERPHGHILRTGRDILPSEDTLSSTVWIYGIFNSQVTVGNTSFNKLLSVARNPLNAMKSSGQRIFVKTDQGYELLGMPSAFETGLNHCRWIYQGRTDVLAVRVWTSMNHPACFLEIEVPAGGPKEFLITHNLVLGCNELDSRGKVAIDPERKRVALTPARSELLAARYPEAKFYIVSRDHPAIDTIAGDGLLFTDGRERNNAFVVVKTRPVERFSLVLTGSVMSAAQADHLADRYSGQVEDFGRTEEASAEFWAALGKHAALGGAAGEAGVARLNDLYAWYLHNALIHYTLPHGLEQYSGAAWGLRDVCQGPIEMLSATRNPQAMHAVLKIIFTHQYQNSGDWPQWFMFDRYQEIQAHKSHGDIILWPIKAVCDYVELTNDLSLLDEQVPYTDERSGLFAQEQASIYSHIEKEIAAIKNRCLPGTSLMSYGHGDWEDTLQPADPTMRRQMVSAWTVELAYQTLKRFQRVCKRAGKTETAKSLGDFTADMRHDFNRYLIRDKVVAGMAYFKENNKVEYLFHPLDTRTGVTYRLLPMTRGMTSGIFTPEQAERHLEIIENNLKFPDGVRLMNKPIPYRGGIEKYFKRAETASNFGREIGLQYVHAHIRYLDALAKLGRAQELYTGLQVINPITIDKAVPTAVTRQSNAYFSSSDAAFADRYEAVRNFGKIKMLEVKVKGGWRVYSSGPGIYLHNLVSVFLGLRELFEDVVFDPVLPKKLDGLTFDFEYAGRKVRYQYWVKNNVCSPGKIIINGQSVNELRYEQNPYRRGGALIHKKTFAKMLNQAENRVEIYL